MNNVLLMVLLVVLDAALVEPRVYCFKRLSDTAEVACKRSPRTNKVSKDYTDEIECCENGYLAFSDKLKMKKIDGTYYYKCTSCQSVNQEGTWTNWTAWSGCNVECNATVGYKIRIRTCDPDWTTCNGSEYERAECELDGDSCGACWEDWKEWSHWSECSKTCELGQKQRTRSRVTGYREVTNTTMIACKATERDTEQCTHLCNVDGRWSEWSIWGEKCMSFPSGRYRTRSRNCNNPTPRGNGTSCQGGDIDFQKCV